MERIHYIIIQTVLFALYLAFVYFKIGEQESISITGEKLRQKNKSLLPLFTLFFALQGILMSIQSVFAGNATSQILYVLSCAGSWFVGVTYTFLKWRVEYWVHQVASWFIFVFAILAISIEFNSFVGAGLMLIFTSISHRRRYKNYIWWVEIFGALVISLELFQGYALGAF